MSAYEYVNKIWKANPPGPEQLLLDEMFENGSISAFATAESVRKSSDMFKEFTPKVFAAHFRKTKARLGEFGMVSTFHLMVSYNDLMIRLFQLQTLEEFQEVLFLPQLLKMKTLEVAFVRLRSWGQTLRCHLQSDQFQSNQR